MITAYVGFCLAVLRTARKTLASQRNKKCSSNDEVFFVCSASYYRYKSVTKKLKNVLRNVAPNH
jgi:hypothetical protein